MPAHWYKSIPTHIHKKGFSYSHDVAFKAYIMGIYLVYNWLTSPVDQIQRVHKGQYRDTYPIIYCGQIQVQ